MLNVYLQINWADDLLLTSTISYSFNHNQIKTAQYLHICSNNALTILNSLIISHHSSLLYLRNTDSKPPYYNSFSLMYVFSTN